MIQNKTMGAECLGCHESIPPRRLEILPNTKYCVKCSDTGRKRGVTIQQGEGDHSYTDIVILEEEQFIQYIVDAGKISKGASKAEFQNYDEDSQTPTHNLDREIGNI